MSGEKVKLTFSRSFVFDSFVVLIRNANHKHTFRLTIFFLFQFKQNRFKLMKVRVIK
jgi:hypothetical protein